MGKYATHFNTLQCEVTLVLRINEAHVSNVDTYASIKLFMHENTRTTLISWVPPLFQSFATALTLNGD